MDAGSDVLRAVRLTGAVFFGICATDPWVAATPPGRAIHLGGAGPALPMNLVGYDCETAFSRSFGKIVGSSPSQWRRDRSVAMG